MADGAAIKIEDHVATSAGTTIVTARHGVGTPTAVIVARGLAMALREVGNRRKIFRVLSSLYNHLSRSLMMKILYTLLLLSGGFRDDSDSWRSSRGPPRDDRGPPPRPGGGERYSDDRGPPRRSDDREGGGRWRNREDDRDPGPWRRDGPTGGRSEGINRYTAKNCFIISTL